MAVVRSLITSVAFLSIAPVIVSAGDITNLRGELSCSSCSSYTDLSIDLQDSETRRPVATFNVSANGHFEFVGIPTGTYLVTVKNSQGAVAREVISVNGNSGPLSIQLPAGTAPGQSPSTPAAAGDIVSVHRLTHKVPKAAKKEYQKALHAGDDNGTVISCLQRATEIDPEYLEALNNLGSRYIKTQQFDKAITVLEKAAAVDPASGFVFSNLAVALISTHRADEAEHAARRAVQLSGTDVRSRYILGLALFTQKKYNEETIQLLRKSQTEFPNSTLALAVISASHGDRNQARTLLEQYLGSGRVERREQVEQMLAGLR